MDGAQAMKNDQTQKLQIRNIARYDDLLPWLDQSQPNMKGCADVRNSEQIPSRDPQRF
jgi:hypothetical protein